MFGNKDTVVYGRPVLQSIDGKELISYIYDGSDTILFDAFGGGFVTGSAEYEDSFCEYMRQKTGFTVVSCAYSLAPRHKFPTQINEVYEIIRSLTEGRKKIILTGHSAGASLMASVSLMAIRKKEFIIDAVLLNYPVLDQSKDPAERPRREGNVINDSLMRAFSKMYFNNSDDGLNSLASPLLASDEELSEFPPAFVLTCSRDNLRLDGIEFADRLRSLGNKVSHYDADDAHGFIETGLHAYFGEHVQETLHAVDTIDKELEWLKTVLQ